MAKGMSMKVLLELQTKEFQKGLKSIQKQLNGFSNFLKSAFALGSITMFGKQMIQVGKDFEDAMARVQAVSNATQSEFKKMQDEAQRLGSTTRYTATEAAGALENLTRNGMSAAQATKALADVLKLAQANSIDLAHAADIVTNTLNMFNLAVDQTGRVNDVLSSTASHAATDITSLYEAMVNAAPAANVLGFSIEEVSAAIGALAQRGVKGSEAGTKLRIAFQKMADPKVIAKMKEQGIEIDENTMKTEGLLKTVEKLGKADLSLGQLGKIFDAKSAMAVQQLVASFGDLQDMLEITANSAGETERMFNQSVGSVQKELDTLKSMYEGLLITISQKTSGVVKSVIRLLQNLITNFETVGGTIMNIASVAVPLFASNVVKLGIAIKGAMQSAAAGMATLRASMGGIISLVATLVTWVGTALVGAWNRAHKAMKDAKKQMDETEVSVSRMKEDVKKIVDTIGDGSDKGTLNGAVKKATELFPEFADAINNARRIASKTGEWERLKNLLQEIARLQELTMRREANETMKRAQTEAFARYMQSRNWFNAGDAEQVLLEIDKQLNETLKGNKQYISDAWNHIAETLIDAYSIDEKDLPKGVDKNLYMTQKMMGVAGDYGVTPEFKEAYRFIKFINGELSTFFAAGARRGKPVSDLSQAGGTYRAGRQLDTLEALKQFDVLEQDFKNQMDEIVKDDKEANQKRYEIAKDFYDKVMELGLSDQTPQVKKATEELNKYAQYAPKPAQSGGETGGGGSTKTTKEPRTPTDYITDAIEDYNDGVEKLNNRLTAGTITTKDYEKELDNLEDKTWETITAFSDFEDVLEKLGQTALGADLKGKYDRNRTDEGASEIAKQLVGLADYVVPKETPRDTKRDYSKTSNQILEETVKLKFEYAEGVENLINKLKSEIEGGEFDLVKEDAIDMLERLKDAAKEASDEADNLQAKLDLSEAITKLDDEIKSLSQSSFNTFNTVADVMDRLSSSLMSIAQVFDEDLQDSPFFKAFQAFNSVMNSSIQIMEAIMTVIELQRQLETKAAMEKVKNTAVEVAANQAAATSEIEKAAAAAGAAAAGGASSVASIPYVGPALAVAAVASITAAILAAMSKFAGGGIVGGNSYTGDKNIVRANSGEMILNKSQQRNLWDIVNGKSAGLGGQVEFKIRGADLVGAIQNYDSRRRG